MQIYLHSYLPKSCIPNCRNLALLFTVYSTKVKFVVYTDTEQVCKIKSSVPIGITEPNRKMRCIFNKIQYTFKFFRHNSPH